MYVNKDLEEFKQYIRGRKVAVMGMGISNTPLIKYLMDLDAVITVFDKKTEEELGKAKCEEYLMQGVNFSLGENYLDNLVGFDIIFRSPSMRPDTPALEKELDRGAILTSEIEMLIDLCPGKIIGVTGSDGKTTTTTLIYKMLQEEGYHCYLGGNIGIPLFAKIDEMRPDDIVVLELSSFQLMTLKKSPNISVVTNISPNHLDIHKDYREYIDAKRNIYMHQQKDDIVILNYDNEITKEFAETAPGRVRYFSTYTKLDDGVILDQNIIKICSNKIRTQIISSDNILLLGRHNVENACTAIAAVQGLVKAESIVKVLTTFKGVEHRNEFVRELNGVKWYNDSIGSSPSRTIAGLMSFKNKVILIAGGYDKHLDYEEMGKYVVDRTKALVLMGQTKEKIKIATEHALERSEIELPIIECSSLEEAVNKANEIAEEGDIVFFSPASASFDMFKNFEERGKKFKEIVNGLE
ncbi:MAG: UDP-N-acetylmuramoyl-L-alanine--D-glutamate ligase [Clostridia bacterium]|nr:UDP-N-acetylmuramoyl-L-alanine--D-glutamate ligase [Clostridia bacterium]